MVSVIFVCLGNICRSPMAEAVFNHLVAQAGLSKQIVAHSAGTASYHVGEPPCQGTQKTLRQHNIRYNGRAKQVTTTDVATHDYIIALDGSNLYNLQQLDPHDLHADKIHLLLNFAPDYPERDVPDPYYSGGFERVYHLVQAGCQGLLTHIKAEHGW